MLLKFKPALNCEDENRPYPAGLMSEVLISAPKAPNAPAMLSKRALPCSWMLEYLTRSTTFWLKAGAEHKANKQKNTFFIYLKLNQLVNKSARYTRRLK